jgi:SPP1 family predicted phage head-tail adaptor
MRSGQLKYKISILVNNVSFDEYNNVVDNWLVYREVRAGVAYKSGDKIIQEYQLFNTNFLDFVIRYDKFIDANMRILFNDRLYKITYLNKNPYDNTLTISTELINNSGTETPFIITGTTINIIDGGSSGTSGFSGSSGTSGITGNSGTSGSSGISGTSDYNDLLNKPDLTLKVDESELFDITVSKNLCEENFLEFYAISLAGKHDIELSVANSFAVVVPIETGKTYTATKYEGGNRFRIGLSVEYPTFEDLPCPTVYTYFGASTSAEQSHTFTNTYGANYATIAISYNLNSPANVQLEEGSTGTAYEAFGSTTYIKNELIDTVSLGITTSNFIDVKTYGALGDGITDDTAVLEEAFEAAFISKKAVYFPSGTYMIRRSLTLKSGMEIYGNGATLKKITAVTATTTEETPENQEYVTVDSVTGFKVGSQMYIADPSGARFCTYGIITSIDTDNKRIYFTSLYNSIKVGAVRTHTSGRKVSTSFALLRSFSTYYACVGTYIHNLTLDGNRQSTEPGEWTNSCIHIDPVASTFNGITYTYAQSNNTFRDLNILNSPCDGISDQSSGGLVEGCTITNSYKHGVHFGTVYLNGKVNNCNFISTGLSGDVGSGVFWCQQAEDIIVTNNNFKNCYKGCSSVEFSSPPRNSIIANNTFRDITSVVCDFTHNATGSTYGGMIIEGNIVIGLRSNFVKVGFLDSIIINNNIIRSITTAPAYLIIATSVNGLVVTGNLSVTNTDYVNSTNALSVVNANNTWNI